ncbi:hypothetical protein GAYE_PCTG52G1285 [Galdieria yellowstonensis]|uniref:Uncharacterized protein n=1 Tax=Galdieria yellowstonensis TaxID=3028027 RepID=A0AAV9I4M9_9RHOD|nr:hypothetical protein GAYE_PCTG52G1285 [Galdieria yellowstonensis]
METTTSSQRHSYTNENNRENKFNTAMDPNEVVAYALALLEQNGVSLEDPRVSKLLGLASQWNPGKLYENLSSSYAQAQTGCNSSTDAHSERPLSNSHKSAELENLDGKQLQKLRAQIQMYRLLRQNRPVSTSLLQVSAGEGDRQNSGTVDSCTTSEVSQPESLISSASAAAKLLSSCDDSSKLLWEAKSETPSYSDLLEERRSKVESRIESRLKLLKRLPSDLPPHVRVKVAIEEKELKLHKLQDSVRKQVKKEMEKLLSGSFNDSVLSSLRREIQKGDQYNMVSNVAAGTYMNGLPSNVKRTVSRVERRHKQELEERRRARHRQYLASFMEHVRNFREFHNIVSNMQHRMAREVEKYHKEKAREEERRQKKAQQERLKALKENDEEAYFKLLQNTKNTRLMQLLRQTDIYLAQIGAQVRRQKELAESEEPLKARGKERRQGSAQAAAAQALEEAENTLREGGSAADTLEDMRRRRDEYYTITHSITEEITEQPSTLVGGTLKPYQLEGLQWLVSLFNNNLNGILADEMGLGKTIQTIACLCYLMEKKNINGPFLIVVPLSTMSNWIREFDQWAPHIVKVIYRGDPTTRRQIQQHEMVAGTFNVLLTTYEYVIRDKSALSRVKWRYIIIDEGHRMKNAHCKLAMTLGVKYHSRNRLLLTGTPLQNNLHELWALLNFLLPNIFSSSDNFEAWFNAPFQSSALGETAELDEEETMLIINRLHQVLRPFLLRRMKSDVESQLPEKTEHVINCELSAWQKVLYRQISSKGGIAIREGSAAATFNNLIMQMRKVCNHPFLFYYDEDIDQLPREYVIRASGKFLFLSKVLPKLKASGHRVLIFTQMRKVLDFLQSLLELLGIKFLRLDGTTKSDERVDLLEAFNDPESEYFAFLLSTRAGGLGLNLQSADTVIIFDSDWNPMMDMQAQDRAHRIGQTREVKVFRLVCSGTVEEKILEQAQKKLNMDAQVIQAGQFNNRASDLDRRRMLEEILRRQQDDSSRDQAQDDEDTNRMLARSDEEFELFCRIDKERNASHPVELLEDESELPQWILNPREDDNNVGYTEAKLDGRIGRWRRAREEVMYNDNLTEREWDRIVENGGDVDEASRRKKSELEKRRKLGKRGRVSWQDREDASVEDISDSDSKKRKKHRRLLVVKTEEEEERVESEESEDEPEDSEFHPNGYENSDEETNNGMDSEGYSRHSRSLEEPSVEGDDGRKEQMEEDWTSDDNRSSNADEDSDETLPRVSKRLAF